MPKFEQIDFKKENDHVLYKDRENFIKENYPKDSSNYEIQELLNSGLDGMEVLEKRDKNSELEGIVSYVISPDNEEIFYLSIGIMLTREESKGEGVMKQLFYEIKEIAKDSDCEYITAIVDTEEGREFLLNNGFSEEDDDVNGREYLRLDL